MIAEDAPAPGFTLTDHRGQTVSLDDFRGETVVLYFYPKAGSPGCTTQACSIRDRAADYDSADAVVLGVSPDPVDDTRRFADEHDLGFRLLSDPDHAVAERYGVWIEKTVEGRSLWGNERTTFVIGPDGRVRRVLRAVKADAHDELVLGALRAGGREG